MSEEEEIVEREVEKMKRAEKKKRKEMKQMAQTQSQIISDQLAQSKHRMKREPIESFTFSEQRDQGKAKTKSGCVSLLQAMNVMDCVCEQILDKCHLEKAVERMFFSCC